MFFDRDRRVEGDEDGQGSGGACGGRGARRLAGAGGRGGRHDDLGGERGLVVGGREERGPRSLIPCRESPHTLCGWGAFHIYSQYAYMESTNMVSYYLYKEAILGYI